MPEYVEWAAESEPDGSATLVAGLPCRRARLRSLQGEGGKSASKAKPRDNFRRRSLSRAQYRVRRQVRLL